MNVLIVEDSAVMAQMLASVLAEWFMVHSVETLKDAVLYLQETPADAVLLDLILPDAKNLEALEHIRGKFPTMPVLVITQMYDWHLGIRAIKEGAQDFIFKTGMQVDDLRRAVLWAVEREKRTKREP